jgi:hypothetical protein
MSQETGYDRIMRELAEQLNQMNIQEQNEPPTNDHDEAVRRAIAWDRKREKLRTDALRRANLTLGIQLG